MDERAMNDERKTRPSLLLLVRNLQDQRTWSEFFELYGPLILRYLGHMGVTREDALELSQDVLQIVVRRIFEMRFFEQKSYEEIATELGMQKGAVYTAYCRVLKRLRNAVEEIDE